MSSFCTIFYSFSKKSNFQNFDWLNVIFNQLKIPWFLIMTFCLTRLVFDRSKLKKFQFLSFWPNLFFHASFMSRIHMHCIVFYIHLAILQSYLSLFSHITCIHFANLGTELDLKIDWLFFESFVHFSICFFFWWIAENIFLRDMMNANIFFTWFEFKHNLFMGHIVSSLHLLKEKIFFFMCIINLVFKFDLCVFFFPTS